MRFFLMTLFYGSDSAFPERILCEKEIALVSLSGMPSSPIWATEIWSPSSKDRSGPLVALAESAEGAGLLYASSAIIIVSSVIEFIAGIKGVGACSAPQKAAACVKWGIVIAVLYIISTIIGIIGGSQFSIVNLVLNMLLPGLYSYGAMQLKKSVNV